MSIEHNRDFPTVDELSQGFSEFRLPQSHDVVGKTFELFYEDGSKISYTFLDDEIIKVTTNENDTTEISSATYTAVSPRAGIYIIDFVASYGDAKSITTVIDTNKNIATTLIGILPTKEQALISQFERGDKGMPMTSVTAEFKHASLGSDFITSTEKHTFTNELVGERISFRYSTNDVYEHVYLNENFYTWHCISGLEKGLCDTDKCYYLKLDDNLYWFTWLEKVVPTIGSVIEDLAPNAMRSYGKIYGYESYDMGRVTNFPVGSYATLLNTTKH